ncbi:hypothetical protein [Caballeronia humi]|jgi:hypothetical protein|uniref:Uncharacterized protein n=1 Tax=Caballeronia humi TaxID=326474 RepID=A0A158G5Y6_9BURK|nr:hypothetical protein [Caballeronia humi]SAL26820.1 hypothetical protein AWB65_01539 [Caballeronia humi]
MNAITISLLAVALTAALAFAHIAPTRPAQQAVVQHTTTPFAIDRTQRPLVRRDA